MLKLFGKFRNVFRRLPSNPDGNKVIFVEGHDDTTLERYVKDNLEQVERLFSEKGLEFVYLPEWVDDEDGTLYPASESQIVSEIEPDYSVCPKMEERTVMCQASDHIDRKYEQLRQMVPDWVMEQILNKALQEREMLSRMVVSPQNKLILTDYDNMEIELRPMEMAFYFLYLKHPEGINFKDLADYRDELWRYYKHTAIIDDKEKMMQSLDRLLDPFSGSINQQRSRIARAFNEAIGNKYRPELARYYMIEGAKGEDKKILLPRDKVDFSQTDW